MPPIKAKWKIVVKRSPRGMAKAFHAIQKDALGEVGQLWHREMLPRHFWANAPQRYKYQLRTPSYERRKKRKFGHNLPLVWSGALRKAVLEGAVFAVTKSSVKITMTGPRWLAGWIAMAGKKVKIRDAEGNWTGMRKPANYPDKKKEITRVLKNEVEAMAKLMKHRFKEALNSARG